ncbi:tRNA (adenosine(37)-N6)-threonylcarbamoyltransferase complex dimerization subunit type 1 TsaB [Elstera cyanobacteriorum]|uniref:tRNA (adenosine(37)-N6)-threonylcarbamoyltransferase complex dimerization subunit type 1 TsaB n=1 Tax=Elstera cyanobacteriorum TaxID=2022747 RepID=UPI0023527174|nr:tRNA (adenosine(37)-N6)-threonylcarbamoyltransferase complex dimerization subunit type 1 TsaB [Elstera cyanobacteriorum]MCK6443102.1 tRNA (adenosine(37)-N6)-threonylcarbamoyltransferase complex dimerization subunit type 1 TsaB [Elstera cyanobacteriorum]
MTALLVLDASGAAVSVGLVALPGGEVLASDSLILQRGQVEALLPMVAEVRARAGIGFPDLAAVAATVGPGSFTGIRLGLAAARGIGLAAGRPVFGVGSFDAHREAVLAAAPDHPGPLLVLLDSKRHDVFAQAFNAGGAALTPPQVLSPEAVRALAERVTADEPGPLMVAGDAAALPSLDGLALMRGAGGPLPIAAVAACAVRQWQAGGAELPPASPLYLRPPDAVVPQGGGVLPHLRGPGGA